MRGMRCPTCGTENAPDSRFCGGCGARLEPPRVAPTAEIPDDAPYPAPQPAVPTPRARLASRDRSSRRRRARLASRCRPQPRLGSIPPTNPAVGAEPRRERAADRAPFEHRRPTERLPASRPAASAPTDVQRAPLRARGSRAIDVDARAPRRSGALIAVVVIADLGLAAAGGALLVKGLAEAEAAPRTPALKTEALSPGRRPPQPRTSTAAPCPRLHQTITPPEPGKPKEAAKKRDRSRETGAEEEDRCARRPPMAAPTPAILTAQDRAHGASNRSARSADCLDRRRSRPRPIHGDDPDRVPSSSPTVTSTHARCGRRTRRNRRSSRTCLARRSRRGRSHHTPARRRRSSARSTTHEPTLASTVSFPVRTQALVGVEVLVLDGDQRVHAGIEQLLSEASLHVTCVDAPERALAARRAAVLLGRARRYRHAVAARRHRDDQRRSSSCRRRRW